MHHHRIQQSFSCWLCGVECSGRLRESWATQYQDMLRLVPLGPPHLSFSFRLVVPCYFPRRRISFTRALKANPCLPRSHSAYFLHLVISVLVWMCSMYSGTGGNGSSTGTAGAAGDR